MATADEIVHTGDHPEFGVPFLCRDEWVILAQKIKAITPDNKGRSICFEDIPQEWFNLSDAAEQMLRRWLRGPFGFQKKVGPNSTSLADHFISTDNASAKFKCFAAAFAVAHNLKPHRLLIQEKDADGKVNMFKGFYDKAKEKPILEGFATKGAAL